MGSVAPARGRASDKVPLDPAGARPFRQAPTDPHRGLAEPRQPVASRFRGSVALEIVPLAHNLPGVDTIPPQTPQRDQEVER